MPKRILFAVLDWGLGHATRSAAVAECLVERDVDVVFCSSGRALDYLKQRFPEQEAVKLALPEIRYGRRSATPAIFRRALQQSRQNRKEHHRTGALVREFKPDAVVSDNLYGSWSPGIPSALITHQLSLPAPIFRKAVNREMASWLANFYGSVDPRQPRRTRRGARRKQHFRRHGKLSRKPKSALAGSLRKNDRMHGRVERTGATAQHF